MIPKIAFIALSLVMAVSCVFGYVMRGLVDKAKKDRQKAKEDEYRERYRFNDWEDDIS